jgi:predicted small metal-binding protein
MTDKIREFPHPDHKDHNLRSQPSHSMGVGAYSFRCADLGHKCDWEVNGRSSEEVLQRVEEHGRQNHNMQNISDQLRYKIRNNIRLAA